MEKLWHDDLCSIYEAENFLASHGIRRVQSSLIRLSSGCATRHRQELPLGAFSRGTLGPWAKVGVHPLHE